MGRGCEVWKDITEVWWNADGNASRWATPGNDV
jgi:hypothetical protein